MNSVKRCWHVLQSVRAARASRPWRPLGLGLCGVALLGYTQLGVVDAEDGLSDELDGLACDFLLIRIFAGAQFALNQNRIALFEGAGELGEVAPCGHAEPVRGFVRLVGLVRPLLGGGEESRAMVDLCHIDIDASAVVRLATVSRGQRHC
jgi:hypothetical protein